jgi:hypothetical protein
VHHGATVDMIDRGCFDVPEFAWIRLDMAGGCLCFNVFKTAICSFHAALGASTA